MAFCASLCVVSWNKFEIEKSHRPVLCFEFNYNAIALQFELINAHRVKITHSF